MNRWLRVFCLVLALGLLFAGRAGAVGVYGAEYQLSQPDGGTVNVRVWGDEYYRVIETLDGYTLVRDAASGFVCYAKLSADKRVLESTGIPAGNPVPKDGSLTPHVRIDPSASAALIAEKRNEAQSRLDQARQRAGAKAQPAPPSLGDVKGICLLVDFSDDQSTIEAPAINSYCNTPGYSGNGNNGSVRDYFYDVSDTALTYTNYVTPTYYRASDPRTYYENPARPFGEGATELILEALASLDAGGFDFSLYDSNTDGYVDAINCFFAGDRSPEWGVGLWPHSGGLYYAADGVTCFRYQITNIGGSLSLGTFCHENGHMICEWPDLYDYTGESFGVGSFCLMAYSPSDTNPIEPCAPLKDLAGWATVTDLGASGADLPLTAGTNSFYRIPHPTAVNEYFMLENRNKSARDASLPDSGLALWHVDTFGSNDYHEMLPDRHFLVTLVQADGDWDMEHGYNWGDANDLFKAGGVNQCSPTTQPNTNWWDGLPSLKRIYSVSAAGSTITFSHGAPVESGLAVTPASISQRVTDETALVVPIRVMNVMAVPLSYTLTIINASQPGVFSVTPADGVSSGDWIEHALNMNVAGLAYGAYTATVRAYAAVPNAPVDVPVTVNVGPSLSKALDTRSTQWTTEGDEAWFGQAVITHDGVDAAQSGPIGDMQLSILGTNAFGPAELGFYWRVSSELSFDFLRFYIDDVEQPVSISGDTAWLYRAFSIAAGPHTLKWVYEKDESVAGGLDAGWVDQVQLIDPYCQETGDCGPPKFAYLVDEDLCLSVPCPVWGADSYTWYKGVVPLVDDDRTTGSHERTLHVTALGEEDTGYYRCTLYSNSEHIGDYVVNVNVVTSLPVVHGFSIAVPAISLAVLGALYTVVRRRVYR